jgi:hypothetical protein
VEYSLLSGLTNSNEMNSYSLGISGYWLVALILLVFAIILTIVTYKKPIPPISGRRRLILIALRSIGLFLIIFALFEPVLSIFTGNVIKPKVAVLYDDSQSMNLTDAKGKRKEQYSAVLSNAALDKLGKESLIEYRFNTGTYKTDNFIFDSLKLKGQGTNISSSIRLITNMSADDNIAGIVLFSDGSFNMGENPVYDAEKFGKPIFVVGIGDTSEPKDISVQSLLTNEVTFLGNPVYVNANIKASGIGVREVKVKLFDNDVLVGEQLLQITPEVLNYPVTFEFTPKADGIRKLTARVDAITGEFSDKNNQASEFLEVLKNKRRIAIFSGALNPDVSFFKNTVESENGVETKSYIQKKDAEFYDKAPSAADLTNSEIIVLIGFPVSSTPQNILQMIRKELERGKGFIFMASQQTDYNKLKIFEEFLPFNLITTRNQEFMATPDIKPEALSNPLLRVYGSDEDMELWNKLPPVYKTETFVRAKPESEIISNLKVNNVPLKEPMLLMRSFQDKKSVAVMAYGLYRWKLLGFAAEVSKGRKDTPDLYTLFIRNTLKWLSVSESNRFVRIKSDKSFYTQAERVDFTAQVYDAAYTPLDNASVRINLTNGKDTRELVLSSIGDGKYKGNVEGLSRGDYAFSGDASVNNKILGSDKGRISIGELSLEYQNSKMNLGLLKSIAQISGGKFYTLENVSSMKEDIEKSQFFHEQSISMRKEYALWNLPWLLAIAVLCFSMEWLLRKRAGMI